MKTNVYEPIEISDEQRTMLADLLDSERSKRVATRDEIKAFCWEKGSGWAEDLYDMHREEFGSTPALAAVPDLEPEADTPIDMSNLI